MGQKRASLLVSVLISEVEMHARVVLEVGHLSNQDTNGAEESVIVSEVSSFQRLKCMQEWYILGVGKGVLFREVSSVQECPHRERERFHCVIMHTSCFPLLPITTGIALCHMVCVLRTDRR